MGSCGLVERLRAIFPVVRDSTAQVKAVLVRLQKNQASPEKIKSRIFATPEAGRLREIPDRYETAKPKPLPEPPPGRETGQTCIFVANHTYAAPAANTNSQIDTHQDSIEALMDSTKQSNDPYERSKRASHNEPPNQGQGR